jgi:predicted GIY-YIG superfamily endonuclease|tara:strand:- start:2496 stop:3005 length:510 start_codon:yes stop_codon:yes gene_type:complete
MNNEERINKTNDEIKNEPNNDSTCKYYCYIIANAEDRTYNGYTTNLNRRLRQHNGEICGGARATHNRGPWRYVAILTSPGWTTTSCAMKHEWSIKYPTRKRPRPKEFNGVMGRLRSLQFALKQMSPNGLPVLCYIDPLYTQYVSNLCCHLHNFTKVFSLSNLQIMNTSA